MTNTDYKREFGKLKYDRIYIVVRKGDRERIKQATKDKGHDSINDMILAALEQYTGLTGLRLKGEKET